MYTDLAGNIYPSETGKVIFNLWLAAHPTTTVRDAAHELFLNIYDHDPVVITAVMDEAKRDDITLGEKLRRRSAELVSRKAQGVVTRLANWQRVANQLRGFAAGDNGEGLDE